MPESKSCYSCVPHFKTRLVTKKDLPKDEFKGSIKLQNLIKKEKKAQIYYCRLGKTPQIVYVPFSGQSVERLHKLKACEYYCK